MFSRSTKFSSIFFRETYKDQQNDTNKQKNITKHTSTIPDRFPN